VFDIPTEVPFILIADVAPAFVEDRFRAFPVSLIDEEEPVAGFPDDKFRELFPMLIDGAFGFAGLVVGEVIILVFGVVVAAVEDDILGIVVSVSVGVVVISVGAIVVATGIGVIVVFAGIGVVVAAGAVAVVVIVGIGEIIGVIGVLVDDVVVVVGGVFVPDDDKVLFVLRDDGPGDALTALVDVPTPFTRFEDV